jgi:hypothetical protein
VVIPRQKPACSSDPAFGVQLFQHVTNSWRGNRLLYASAGQEGSSFFQTL